MNRRAFFGLIAAAIGLPLVVKRQYWRIIWPNRNLRSVELGEIVLGPFQIREMTEAEMLAFKEELSKKIRKATAELKRLARQKAAIVPRGKLVSFEDVLRQSAKLVRVFIGK